MAAMHPIQSGIMALLALTSGLGAADARAGMFKIHELEAAFEIVPNLEGEFKDVAVILRVSAEPPVDPSDWGEKAVFTFRGRVGHDRIRNVSVSLPDGKPVHYSEDYGDQGSIVQWRFRMLELAPITVVARFTVVDGVRGNPKTNHIDFSWIEDWCDRNSRLTLRFILPKDHPLTELKMEPEGFEKANHEGRPAMQATWDGPAERTFEAHFSPGLVSGKLYVSDEESWILVGSLAGIGLGLAVGLGLIWHLTTRKSRSRRRRRK